MSSWPCGQVAGSPDWLIGLVSRKVSPHARQRNSYRGTRGSYRVIARSPSAVRPRRAILDNPAMSYHLVTITLGKPQGRP